MAFNLKMILHFSIRRDEQSDSNFLLSLLLAGSWTPLHADVFRSYSWSANVCGKKRWFFLDPSQCHLVFDRHFPNRNSCFLKKKLYMNSLLLMSNLTKFFMDYIPLYLSFSLFVLVLSLQVLMCSSQSVKDEDGGALMYSIFVCFSELIIYKI